MPQNRLRGAGNGGARAGIRRLSQAYRGEEGAVESYPRLQKLQRMLDVLDRTIAEAERRQGDPEVRILIARGGDEAGVHLSYHDEETYTTHNINLGEELGFGSGETIGLFRWAESEGYIRPNYGSGGRDADTAMAVLDHLESTGYELIGELLNPEERLALILDAAIRAVQRDQSLTPEERQRRIDWFEEAKFVVRTFGVEVAKAVWRGDLPPM
jgi:hypothetical protein